MKEKTGNGIARHIKSPQTDYDLHSLIEKRWSPRSFSEKEISEEQLFELFDAARWAASAFNEQPWQYVYAFSGTPGFEQLWNCLMPGNQPWTKSAAVLMVTMYRKSRKKTGTPNSSAAHDLGMANAHLLLQAAHRNIYGHLMGGFDKDKIRALLSLDDDVQPVCMAALGYLGEPDALEEPYKTRELTPRSRLPLEEFAKKI